MAMAYRITILCDNTVVALSGTLGEHDFAALLEWDGGSLLFDTGQVPIRTTFEQGDAGIFCDEAGCAVDEVPDDQSLVIVTDRGLVLLLGCCHAGLVNTIEHARDKTGIEDVYAVIGGTHLGFSDPAQLDATVKALRGYRISKLCAGHCTGFAASARLLKEFPGRFQPAQVGFTIEF